MSQEPLAADEVVSMSQSPVSSFVTSSKPPSVKRLDVVRPEVSSLTVAAFAVSPPNADAAHVAAKVNANASLAAFLPNFFIKFLLFFYFKF